MSKDKEPKEELKPITTEELMALFTEDGIAGLYFAMNRKLNEIATALNGTTLELDGDDRAFERFLKLAVDNKDVVENMTFMENKLKERFKTDDVESVRGAKTPILEDYVKNRNNAKN